MREERGGRSDPIRVRELARERLSDTKKPGGCMGARV